MNSLNRSNVVLISMMVDKAFCKSTDGSFGRSIACWEDKSVSRVIVYSSQNKMVLLPWWKQSTVINLSPGSWLVTLGNCAISEAQYWSLLLADWAVGRSYSKVHLGEWKSMYNLHMCHFDHLCDGTGDQRERPTGSTEWVILPTFTWDIPSGFHLFLKIYPHISSPAFLVNNFSTTSF